MNCVGVDMGGTRIKIGLVNEDALVASTIIDSRLDVGFTQNLYRIQVEVESLIAKAGAGKVEHIGIAFPGLVDTVKSAVIDTSGKYEGADKTDLVAWARNELDMELRMENDARLACLGEWRFGAGRDTNDMVFYSLGTGVGSSAIVNSQIMRGKHYQAGILGGHFIIDYTENTAVCSCGNYGCVESLASTWAMKNAAEKDDLYNESVLKTLQEVDLEAVFNYSEKGDRLALRLRKQCLDVWGIGIVNLIHAYDPEVVVVGGGVSRAKDVLIPHFDKMIKARAWTPWGTPEIRMAEHPDTAAVLG
ncbi:MAG: ROK family protein, partial [Segetibacter sp.]